MSDTYRIRAVCFEAEDNVVAPAGVLDEAYTGSTARTLGIVRPAVPNTRMACSPYGQSVFAGTVDAIQSVDLAFDAPINEVDAGKMRMFLSNVMFDQKKNDKGTLRTRSPSSHPCCATTPKAASCDWRCMCLATYTSWA